MTPAEAVAAAAAACILSKEGGLDRLEPGSDAAMLLLLERSFSASKSNPPPSPALALSTHSSRPVGLEADMRLRWDKGTELGLLGDTVAPAPMLPLSGVKINPRSDLPLALSVLGIESLNMTSCGGGGGVTAVDSEA